MIPFHEFVHLYRARLNERSKELSDPLLEGGAEDHAQYRRYVGEIAGLKAAREEFDALVKRANDGEV